MSPETARVLVADDDPSLRVLLRDALEQAQYRVSVVDDGDAALCAARATPFDLLILDVTMPAMDGLEVCRCVRATSDVPIIMLTARDTVEDIVRGLDAGADDYLSKPFVPAELLARIRAALRRPHAGGAATDAGGAVVRTGRLEINLAQYRARLDGHEIALTPLERRLLEHFGRHLGRTLEADRILTRVWGPAYAGDPAPLQVAISRLRQKIEPDPARPTYIRTIPGIGYLLASVER